MLKLTAAHFEMEYAVRFYLENTYAIHYNGIKCINKTITRIKRDRRMTNLKIRRFRKRLLSMILAATTFFSSIDLTAFATENEMTDVSESTQSDGGVSIGDSGVSVNAGDDFGSLIAGDIQNLLSSEQEAMYESYGISDITASGTTVTVTLHAVDECTVVVVIYEEGNERPYAFGKALVNADDREIDVAIDTQTMPEYFEVKAYIVDTHSLRPLSEEFYSRLYTEDVQNMEHLTVDDFEPDLVVNLDDDKTTNFVVFDEGTIVARGTEDTNVLVFYDETTGTYSFKNPDEKIINIKAGDIFVYQDRNNDISFIKVKEVVSDSELQSAVNVDESIEENIDEESSDEESPSVGDAESSEAADEDTKNSGAEDTDTESPKAEDADAESPEAENTDTENSGAENPDTEDTDAEGTDTPEVEESAEKSDEGILQSVNGNFFRTVSIRTQAIADTVAETGEDDKQTVITEDGDNKSSETGKEDDKNDDTNDEINDEENDGEDDRNSSEYEADTGEEEQDNDIQVIDRAESITLNSDQNDDIIIQIIEQEDYWSSELPELDFFSFINAYKIEAHIDNSDIIMPSGNQSFNYGDITVKYNGRSENGSGDVFDTFGLKVEHDIGGKGDENDSDSGDKSDSGSGDIETPIGTEIDVEVSFAFAADIKYYYNKPAFYPFQKETKFLSCRFMTDTIFSGGISVSAEINIPLIVGAAKSDKGPVQFEYTPYFFISGAITASFKNAEVRNAYRLVAGTNTDVKPGFYSENPEKKKPDSLEIEASVEIGVKWEPVLKVVLDEDDKWTWLDAQFKLKALLGLNVHWELVSLEQHPCNNKCCDINAYFKLVYGLTLEVLGKDILAEWVPNLPSEGDIINIPIFSAYLCLEHGKFEVNKKCPYVPQTSTVTVKVQTVSGILIKGAKVTSNVSDDTAYTDENGIAELELPRGKCSISAQYLMSPSNIIERASAAIKLEDDTAMVNLCLGTTTGMLPSSQYVVKADTANGYNMLITRNGSLYTWGSNTKGIVGNGSTDSWVNNPVKVLSDVKDVVVDKSSFNSVAAVTTSGKLYMWGDNSYGQLGLGSDVPSRNTPTLVEIEGADSPVDKVVVDSAATAVILRNGDLYMWGYNHSGRIGTGDDSNRYTPYRVMEGVKDVKINYENTVVLTQDGKSFVWGNMQIVNGNSTMYYEPNLDEPLFENVESIELSQLNGAVLLGDGSLYVWGDQDVCSNGTLTEVKGLPKVKKVKLAGARATRGAWAAVITDGNKLYMWGDTACGQILYDEKYPETVTEPVLIDIPDVDEVEFITGTLASNVASYTIATMVITKDHVLWISGRRGGADIGFDGMEQLFTGVASVSEYTNGDSNCIVVMQDGTAWLSSLTSHYVENWLQRINLPQDETDTINAYALLDIEGYDESTAGDGETKTVTYNNLLPDELYNFYVMKSESAVEPLGSDNLLSVAQGTSDADGNLSFTYIMKEAFESPDIILRGRSYLDIADAQITVENNGILEYTGSEQFVNLEVVYGETKLTDGSDYYLSGDFKATEMGRYTVNVVGTGLYSGKQSVTYWIGEAVYNVTFDSAGGSEVASQSVGEGKCAIEPEKPTRDGYRFVGWYLDDEPYDFTQPVTRDIVLQAKWEATATEPEPGDDTERDDVLPDDIPAGGIPEGLWIAWVDVEHKDSYPYTGSAIKPEVRVYDHKTLLAEKTDYTIAYKNNTKANDATVAGKAPTITVTGKGNYSGRETMTFKILPVDISPVDISLEDDDKADEFEADDISVVYNGKAQKPIPTLYWNGKKLTNKTDYTFTYHEGTYETAGADAVNGDGDLTDTGILGSVKEPGDYYIKLTGKGNFTGTRRLKLTVLDSSVKPISKATVTKIPDQSYLTLGRDGAVTPDVTVKYGSETLTLNEHYTVAYSNNDKVGTAYAIITGREEGGYSGTKRVSFKITGVAVSKAKVSGLSGRTFIYNGSDIEPTLTLTVKLNGTDVDLVQGTDYSVTWQKNLNKGTATVIFTGKDGYTGTLKKTFKIKAFNIAENKDGLFKVELKSDTVPYAKGGAKPELTVTFQVTDGTPDGTQTLTLKEGTDYTVSYKNNKAVNDGSTPAKIPTLTIKGKGNFTGTYSQNLTYKITEQDLGKLKLTAADKVYQNKKNIYSTKVTITDLDGKALKAGTDYEKTLTYTYKNDTTLDNGMIRRAGEAVDKNDIIPADTEICVEAVSKGSNYTGTLSGEYSFKEYDISGAKVTIPKQTYTGRKITLDKTDEKQILVKVKGKKVEPDQFDIVGYTNNVQKGTATVTLKGKDNYGGTKTVKFTIKAKGFLWWWNK